MGTRSSRRYAGRVFYFRCGGSAAARLLFRSRGGEAVLGELLRREHRGRAAKGLGAAEALGEGDHLPSGPTGRGAEGRGAEGRRVGARAGQGAKARGQVGGQGGTIPLLSAPAREIHHAAAHATQTPRSCTHEMWLSILALACGVRAQEGRGRGGAHVAHARAVGAAQQRGAE